MRPGTAAHQICQLIDGPKLNLKIWGSDITEGLYVDIGNVSALSRHHHFYGDVAVSEVRFQGARR